MRLELNGIDVDCVIGERTDERTRNQRLRVDVALEFSSRAVETDDLADTVDYADLTDRIRAMLVTARCRMIERAAQLVVDACLFDGRVKWASAKVTKFGAIPHLESASAFVESGRE